MRFRTLQAQWPRPCVAQSVIPAIALIPFKHPHRERNCGIYTKRYADGRQTREGRRGKSYRIMVWWASYRRRIV